MPEPLESRVAELLRMAGEATPLPWDMEPIVDNHGKPYATLYQTWVFIEPSVCGLWANEGKNLADAKYIVSMARLFPDLAADWQRRGERLERFEKAEAVMLKRGWSPLKSPVEGEGWRVDLDNGCYFAYGKEDDDGKYVPAHWPNPTTAILEADAWYVANGGVPQ